MVICLRAALDCKSLKGRDSVLFISISPALPPQTLIHRKYAVFAYWLIVIHMWTVPLGNLSSCHALALQQDSEPPKIHHQRSLYLILAMMHITSKGLLSEYANKVYKMIDERQSNWEVDGWTNIWTGNSRSGKTQMVHENQKRKLFLRSNHGMQLKTLRYSFTPFTAISIWKIWLYYLLARLWSSGSLPLLVWV